MVVGDFAARNILPSITFLRAFGRRPLMILAEVAASASYSASPGGRSFLALNFLLSLIILRRKQRERDEHAQLNSSSKC